MSLRSCVVPRSIPSCILTCVIFARSQTSHVMYHVISFNLSISHMTSHMTNPDTQLPMPTFPLWNADTITGLGRLPNQDIGSTSYLGNTPIQKLQNSNDWKTQWPDHDIRTSFPSPKTKWLWPPEMWKGKADLRIGAFVTCLNLKIPPPKHWVTSNAHSIQFLNQRIAYPLNSLKTYNIYLVVKILAHPIWAIMLDSTMHWYLSVMSMAYGLKYTSKKTSSNASDWLEVN